MARRNDVETLIFWLWSTFVFGLLIVFALYMIHHDRRRGDPAE